MIEGESTLPSGETLSSNEARPILNALGEIQRESLIYDKPPKLVKAGPKSGYVVDKLVYPQLKTPNKDLYQCEYLFDPITNELRGIGIYFTQALTSENQSWVIQDVRFKKTLSGWQIDKAESRERGGKQTAIPRKNITPRAQFLLQIYRDLLKK